MTPSIVGRALRPTLVALALLALLVVFDTALAGTAKLLLALGVLATMGGGAALRAAASDSAHETAPVPVLLGLGLAAAETPVVPLAELLVGVAAVAFVAWLADDPDRPPAGVARGALEWSLPMLAVGLAWASSFLLPPTAAPLGVAGGLLAASLIVLVYLVQRPELFETAGPATI